MEFESIVKVIPKQVDELGHLNYRLECFVDEELKVRTVPLSRGRKSFVLAHEIVKPDGRVAIDGTVTSLIMDMERHTTLPVPEPLARYLPAPE
jgi:thioesterase-3